MTEIEGTEERFILLYIKGSSVSNNGWGCGGGGGGGGGVVWFDIVCGVAEWAMVTVLSLLENQWE